MSIEEAKCIIAWWSGGITSAVACRLALESYTNVRLVYIETGSHHPDSLRFKNDCERWYGREIEVWQNKQYKNHLDVILKTRFINGPFGARCTLELKKKVREEIEASLNWSNQVFGFEFEKSEINRAIRWQEQFGHTNPLFPLIEAKLNKNECAGIVQGAGIKLPEMYKLGYNNNNCIGCVKGGAGYWNKIRKDFPNVFQQMAEAEREIGATCLKDADSNRIYLDELNPKIGNTSEAILGDCGIFCQVEFSNILSPKAQEVIEGTISIYKAA